MDDFLIAKQVSSGYPIMIRYGALEVIEFTAEERVVKLYTANTCFIVEMDQDGYTVLKRQCDDLS